MSSESDKEQAARNERAAKLRKRIGRLIRGGEPDQTSAPPENPRDFVEKQMREQREKDKKGGT